MLATDLDTTARCWWCGGVADSAEHKFKRRDLELIYGPGIWRDGSAVAHMDGEFMGRPNSSRSERMKFGKVMCRDCNSKRSQPFDRAYDRLFDYLIANDESLLASGILDWEAALGADWETGILRVTGYWVKHIACRVAEAGRYVHPALPDFLDGKAPLSHLRLSLSIGEDAAALHNHLRSVHDASARGLWMGGLAGWLDPDDGRLLSASSHWGFHWLRLDYSYDVELREASINYAERLVRLPREWSIDPSTVADHCRDCMGALLAE